MNDSPVSELLSLTQIQQIDSHCERYEQSLQRGSNVSIEDFLAEVDSTMQSHLFVELLRLECEYRSRDGGVVDSRDYRERFPHFESLIDKAFHETRTESNTGVDPAAAHAAVLNLTPGDLIEEFEICKILGRGAFGTVYLARQRGLEREVALKVFTVESMESRTMAHLDGHPCIVRVYDQRYLPERRLRLIYMEYVHGETLRSVIRSRKDQSLPCDQAWIEQVCRLGSRLADALEFAHERKVLHCDIKPANIMLDAQGAPKLVDFNIAHRMNIDETQIGGTFPYMSPEQIDAYKEADLTLRRAKIAALDGRSDLYSLGIVIWELVTGARPFNAVADADVSTSLTLLSDQRKAGLDRSLIDTLPDAVSPGLQHVLVRSLAATPDSRYALGGQLAHDLRLCTQSDLQTLLFPRPGNWKALVLNYPLATWILIAITCNGVLAGVSIWYNYDLIAEGAAADLNRKYFLAFVFIINSIAFVSGIAWGSLLVRPVNRSIRLLNQGVLECAEVAVINRCVLLGHCIALVSFAAWTIASAVWGVAMGVVAWGATAKTFHFVASVFLCGIIASGLVYFALSFIVVRAILPRLVRSCRTRFRTQLDGPTQLYLGSLILCPLATLMMLTLAKNDVASSRALMSCLCVMSAIAVCMGLISGNAIRKDLQTLSKLESKATSPD